MFPARCCLIIVETYEERADFKHVPNFRSSFRHGLLRKTALLIQSGALLARAPVCIAGKLCLFSYKGFPSYKLKGTLSSPPLGAPRRSAEFEQNAVAAARIAPFDIAARLSDDPAGAAFD